MKAKIETLLLSAFIWNVVQSARNPIPAGGPKKQIDGPHEWNFNNWKQCLNHMTIVKDESFTNDDETAIKRGQDYYCKWDDGGPIQTYWCDYQCRSAHDGSRCDGRVHCGNNEDETCCNPATTLAPEGTSAGTTPTTTTTGEGTAPPTTEGPTTPKETTPEKGNNTPTPVPETTPKHPPETTPKHPPETTPKHPPETTPKHPPETTAPPPPKSSPPPRECTRCCPPPPEDRCATANDIHELLQIAHEMIFAPPPWAEKGLPPWMNGEGPPPWAEKGLPPWMNGEGPPPWAE